MPRRAALAGLASERLKDVLSSRLGLRLRPARPPRPDAHADLIFEVRDVQPPRRLHVEIQPRFLRQHLRALAARARALRRADALAVPVLMVPRLSPRSRDGLRAAGVNHADLSGVVYVHEAGLHIDVDGDAPQPRSVREAARLGFYGGEVSDAYRVNPFSDKASLVVRVLLGAAGRPLRHSAIRAQAPVTKGWVSLVARALVRRGYAERVAEGVRLGDAVSVLKDWTGAYAWDRNRMVSYVAPFAYEELLAQVAAALREIDAGWALTLLAGMDHVAPHVQHGQVHAYIRPADFGRAQTRLRERLHLEPVAHGGTFHLLEPYYAVSAFHGQREVGGYPVVSDLQLYLDLAGYPLRGGESAEFLMRSRLGPALGLDARQMDELP
jgi:hypothetical protein